MRPDGRFGSNFAGPRREPVHTFGHKHQQNLDGTHTAFCCIGIREGSAMLLIVGHWCQKSTVKNKRYAHHETTRERLGRNLVQ